MAHVATAAIIVPGSDGSDGVLNITEDTVIDLDAKGNPIMGKIIGDAVIIFQTTLDI